MSAKTRIWVLLTAVLCLGLLILGVVGGLLPQFASAASTRSLTEDQKMLNDVQRARLTQLQQAKENLGELESQLAELEKAIPPTAASVEWIEELHQAELRNGVMVNQFEVQVPLAQPEQEAPAAEETEAAGDENGDEAGPTSEPAPAPTFSGSQPIPVIIEVAGGTRESVTAFLRDLQVGGRLFLVQNIEILEDERDEGVFWRGQVQGFLYAKLD